MMGTGNGNGMRAKNSGTGMRKKYWKGNWNEEIGLWKAEWNIGNRVGR